MRQTAFYDLHCDTITEHGSLDGAKAAFSLSALPEEAFYAQCCAIFIPDSLRGDAAVSYYERYRDVFYAECEKHAARAVFCRTAEEISAAHCKGKTALLLTVESGAALSGDLSRTKALARDGVSILTLVWNGQNELGAGHEAPKQGLTPFGKRAVRALEDAGILLDVSHLNDRGFDELCSLARRPFLATHSNARAVTPHSRNLTDRQICEIVRRGGLIGLNFYNEFLRTSPENVTPDDVYRHVSHFLSLGAQNALAFGSDFDGADVPEFLSSPGALPALCEYLLSKNISEAAVRALAWENAARFFEKWL